MTDQDEDTFLELALSDGTPIRAAKTAAIVGSLLTAINQSGALLALAQGSTAEFWSAFSWLQFGLTALVPYCVATVGAVGAKRKCACGKVADMSATPTPAPEPDQACPHARNSHAESSRIDISAAQDAASQALQYATGVKKTAESVNSASKKRLEALEELTERAESSASEADHINERAQASCESLVSARESVSEVLSLVEHMAGESEAGADVCRKTHDALKDFNERFENIDRMAHDIGEIAKQTNLLALNATIEAARAGEAGKGFAVVAQEVKALANKSGKSAEHINGTLDTLSGSAKAVTERMDDLMSRMTALRERGETSRQSVSAVSDAIEDAVANAEDTDRRSGDQARAAKEVAAKLDEVKEDTRKAVAGSAENIDRGEKLVSAVDEAAREIAKLD